METSNVTVRKGSDFDIPFALELSPVLAGVAVLPWHSSEVIEEFQTNYINKMLLNKKHNSAFFIAEDQGKQLGFIYVCEHQDEISGEKSATIPLLAVESGSQGKGVGNKLLHKAETWALEQGFRLLHLEVFSANENGLKFYHRNNFKADTLSMIKQLTYTNTP